VRASGARIKALTRSTSRGGMATLRVRPRARGAVTVRVSLRGYVTRRVRVRVR
jgi:hypothetical protein